MKQTIIPKKPGMSLLIFGLICLVSINVTCHKDQKSKSRQAIKAELESVIDSYAQNLFSGVVLVAKEGAILIHRGYGYANMEHDIPNRSDTKFRIGSITKSFTAMAILQLKQKGLLDLTDTVKKYFPGFPRGDKITIHHLLVHTSGIPDIEFFSDYQQKKVLPFTCRGLIDWIKSKPFLFEPGQKWSYSSSGYILLGGIIEKISGKPFELYIKENILVPLNMKDTGYDHHGQIIRGRAAGYRLKKNKLLVNADYVDMSIPHAAGAMYSTAWDLYLWDRSLYTEQLVSMELLNKMFTPYMKTPYYDLSYGCGWLIGEQFGRKRIVHTGGIDGFSAILDRYPEDDVCIVILCNLRGNVSLLEISNEIADIIFKQR